MKLLTIIALIVLSISVYYYYFTGGDLYARPYIENIGQIVNLFPASKEDVAKKAENAIKDALERLEPLYTIKKEDRTFENTMRALDVTIEYFTTAISGLYVVSLVCPDDDVRMAAHEETTKLQAFSVDVFNLNRRLYKACAEFEDLIDSTDYKGRELTPQERYFVTETLRDFKRSGLALPEKEFERVSQLTKEFGNLKLDFERNILQSNKIMELTQQQLAGVDQQFLDSLSKTSKGAYIIPVNVATLQRLLVESTVLDTRKKLYRDYMQTAYPANEHLLNKMIAVGNELAELLGYKSFAYLDIDNQMARTPETVKEFLEGLIKRAQLKTKQEVELLKKELPAEFSLTSDGAFYPWDLSRVRYLYKKKHLEVDEIALADYFPLEHTLPALLKVYEQFFGLTFKKVKSPTSHFWHEEVEVWSLYKDGVYRGTLLLDLFPRPNKYTHAGTVSVVPCIVSKKRVYPGVVFLVANFPSASAGKPVLLKKYDVNALFHELGHALHDLLSTTELASLAGTRVKGDFLEMPSQMLEEWMYEPEILKMISSHYQTKQPLSDAQIAQIGQLKRFSSGDEILKQLYYALYCLELYMPGKKDAKELWKSLHEKLLTHYIYDAHNHGYCSFNHLSGYGAKYYGYLWSKVFALDLFHALRPQGLLNKENGKRYTDMVIGKGGGEDPEEILEKFLGRKPNQDAFFKDLGL